MVTIYSLCDPITKEPRYVGKANNLNERIRLHLIEAKNPKFKTRKVNWLRSINYKPEVKILQVVNDNVWQDAEIFWINKLKFQCNDLTNCAKGGQTSPVEGIGHTEETKRKLSEHHIRAGIKPPSRKGQPVSELARIHMREAAIKRGAKPPMIGGWNKGIRKTYCPKGHEYTPENTRLYHRPDRNQTYQICKICAKYNQEKCHSRRK